MNELVTVVVPVYNVEKYLKRCVDSLINQTYKNLEIILVDDGSTDNSGKLCNDYAKDDSRIKVVHKKNGGLSDARNAGIDIASGKYISFVDSDDWLTIDAIEILYNNIKKYNAEISSASMIEIFSDKNNIIIEPKYECTIFDTISGLENMMYLHGITNSACAKLYKTELFDDIRFPKGKLYEDLGTTYKVYAKSSKSVLINRVIYYYFQNINSIMHYKYSSRRMEGIPFAKNICDFFEKNYPEIINAGIFRLYYECLLVLNDMPLKSKDKIEVFKIMKKYRKIVLKDKKIYKKQKLLCIASLFGHLAIKAVFSFKEKRKKF